MPYTGRSASSRFQKALCRSIEFRDDSLGGLQVGHDWFRLRRTIGSLRAPSIGDPGLSAGVEGESEVRGSPLLPGSRSGQTRPDRRRDCRIPQGRWKPRPIIWPRSTTRWALRWRRAAGRTRRRPIIKAPWPFAPTLSRPGVSSSGCRGGQIRLNRRDVQHGLPDGSIRQPADDHRVTTRNAPV